MLTRPHEAIRFHHPPGDPADALDSTVLLRHDLRSLLTPIRGRAQLLARALERDQQPPRERLLAHLAAIESATDALAARIDQIGKEERD